MREGRPYSDWAIHEQLRYYVIAHEIGHALDHWSRQDISKDDTIDIEEEEDWEIISAHYAPMLVREYLACVLAARSVAAELQSDMLEHWHNDIEQFTSHLDRKRRALFEDWGEIIGCFWVILIQLGKLLGHDRDEEDFPTIAFKEFDWEEERTQKERQAIITELDQTLYEFRKNYPAIPSNDEITERLSPYFLRLAGSYDYYLRDEDIPLDLLDDDE